jgi:hypothetical protein
MRTYHTSLITFCSTVTYQQPRTAFRVGLALYSLYGSTGESGLRFNSVHLHTRYMEDHYEFAVGVARIGILPAAAKALLKS